MERLVRLLTSRFVAPELRLIDSVYLTFTYWKEEMRRPVKVQMIIIKRSSLCWMLT